MHDAGCSVTGAYGSQTFSVLDAALLWFGMDLKRLPHYGQHEWIVRLTRHRKVYDFACLLLSGMEKGSIKVKEASPLSQIPDSWRGTLGSMPGNLDPSRTLVDGAELVKLAIARGQKPTFLAPLLVEQTTQIVGAEHPSSVDPPKPRSARDAEIKRILATQEPGQDVSWKCFCDTVRDNADGWIKKSQSSTKKGFSDKSIQRAVRHLEGRHRTIRTKRFVPS
jgi:hypothetical protein